MRNRFVSFMVCLGAIGASAVLLGAGLSPLACGGALGSGSTSSGGGKSDTSTTATTGSGATSTTTTTASGATSTATTTGSGTTTATTSGTTGSSGSGSGGGSGGGGPGAKLCKDTGGTASTSLCCSAVSDFPDQCGIGACGCSPNYSHEVKVCVCPASKCFDGKVGCK